MAAMPCMLPGLEAVAGSPGDRYLGNREDGGVIVGRGYGSRVTADVVVPLLQMSGALAAHRLSVPGPCLSSSSLFFGISPDRKPCETTTHLQTRVHSFRKTLIHFPLSPPTRLSPLNHVPPSPSMRTTRPVLLGSFDLGLWVYLANRELAKKYCSIVGVSFSVVSERTPCLVKSRLDSAVMDMRDGMRNASYRCVEEDTEFLSRLGKRRSDGWHEEVGQNACETSGSGDRTDVRLPEWEGELADLLTGFASSVVVSRA